MPVLSAYPTLDKFLKAKAGRLFDWDLDSGAYSALRGKEIDLGQYTEDCLRLLSAPCGPTNIFALDVIGDPEQSVKNTEAMWQAGIKAVPTFHYGSPWHYLIDLCKRYDRIALGGLVARTQNERGDLTVKQKREFLGQAFARAWPKWIHGFGCTDRRILLHFPFAQTDSTSWFFQVSKYGCHQMISENGRSLLPTKGENPAAFAAAVRTQVEWYRTLMESVRAKFGRVLSKAGIEPYKLRLVVSGPELEYLIERKEAVDV